MNQTITEPIFEVAFPAPALTKGEREYQTFLRLLPELLKTHASGSLSNRSRFIASLITGDAGREATRSQTSR